MEFKALLTASLVLPLAFAGRAPDCFATVFQNADGSGPTHTYGKGKHQKLGSWNDRIAIVAAHGGDGCYARVCEHTSFKGKCERVRNMKAMLFNNTLLNKISSIEVGHSRRRIDEESVNQDLAGLGEFFAVDEDDSMKFYDPLCEAVYHDMQEFGWQVFANSTIKHWEMENLVDSCETSFSEQGDVNRCKFYVYAATEILDDDSILKTLEIPAEESNERMNEYQRCGLLSTKINSVIESGKLSGVEIVQMDGEDFFSLEDPITADSVDLVPNDGGKFNAVVSAGSLLAMWIGSTLVKVCRDFDPQTGAWLLA